MPVKGRLQHLSVISKVTVVIVVVGQGRILVGNGMWTEGDRFFYGVGYLRSCSHEEKNN